MASPSQLLSELPLGTVAVVRELRGEPSLRLRLMEMGLVPGTPVSVRRRAPLGDPLELSVRGYSLSIRGAEASQIQVEVSAA
jgi:ferrous iron transport protein A